MATGKGLVWRIGAATITSIVEIDGPPMSIRFLFDDLPAARVLSHAWLRPDFVTGEGRLKAYIQAFVVESAGRRIIVDTCIGNDKARPAKIWHMLQGGFLADLAAAGFAPDSIDTVLCTHLHVDHVGWNTRLEAGCWVPTFPRARYLFGRVEWAHWAAQPEPEGGPVTDSVRPIVDAGLCHLVETDHRLTDEVWLEPTPGHTPGHVSVHVASGGQHALITGDFIHHPVQIAEPDLSSRVDTDPAQSRTTRHAFLRRHAGGDLLLIGSHFAPPTAGRIVADGSGYRLRTLSGPDAARI